MRKGNNVYGAAGKRGIPATTVVAFLDHYTYLGQPVRQGHGDRVKRINGLRIDDTDRRTIRRWRSGAVDLIQPARLVALLSSYGFDIAWFQGWCGLHHKPLTRKG